jgi:hypothetical protein
MTIIGSQEARSSGLSPAIEAASVVNPLLRKTDGRHDQRGKSTEPDLGTDWYPRIRDPGRLVGRDRSSAAVGNPAIDFVGGLERNWSNVSGREYSQWHTGLVLKTGWRF